MTAEKRILRFNPKQVTFDDVAELLRSIQAGRSVVLLSGDAATDVLKLAAQSFSDSGTPVGALDEELQCVDDELEKMGYARGMSTKDAVALLCRRVRRTEATLKRIRDGARKPTKKRRR